ncbi:hypothetical protein PAXRUDRAFT_267757 [Paxillus rubicundulus Ve08.2h10]|uniref:Unplaced genomic scaffold scaffold_138, whole genome shotgun sequence n=1 Tax=Paxillus rubicundulus Ve08.2h10 TaxID=930991 RepID=A0A0D0E666_9AGAM|nr:hypothetical protein PAXRUDRAFT_267757 [Paxillus rubicundulus Ve08.2h10]
MLMHHSGKAGTDHGQYIIVVTLARTQIPPRPGCAWTLTVCNSTLEPVHYQCDCQRSGTNLRISVRTEGPKHCPL